MGASATVAPVLQIDQDRALALAREFGTPLYAMDRRVLRSRARHYRAAWTHGQPWFASKANSVPIVVRTLWEEGFKTDVASEGELRVAMAAGVPAEDCCLHGFFKSDAEIAFALESGIGRIVADNMHELQRLAALGTRVPLLMRLAPSVETGTNEKISTAHADTKFGFPISTGEAEQALRFALASGLKVEGFHCHVGSQVLEPSVQCAGGEALARFAESMRAKHGYEAHTINTGGGFGVPYLTGQAPLDIVDASAKVAAAVRAAFPSVQQIESEPGRWLVAEAGVTLYKVGPVRKAASGRTYVGVNGGLADNPRPALYGAAYHVRHIPADGRTAAPEMTVTVAGRHCESDTLFKDINLPEDVRAGDLLEVYATGAYNSSMASNYNRYPRPATVMLEEDGTATIAQRSESWEQVMARDVTPC